MAQIEKESGTSELVRKFKANPALYIGSVVVLILVTVTFIGGDFFSSGGGMRGGDLTFGYYDGVPISYVPGNKFSQYIEELSRQYRNQIDFSNYYAMYSLWWTSFQRAAMHTAVLQEMKKSNFEMPDKIVDRGVASLPQFQDGGRFSPALYRQMSDSTRLSLWRQVKDELTVAQYKNDIYGLLMPQSEIDFIGGMVSDSRTFDMVSFLVDDFPQQEFVSYGQENADLFKSIHLSRIVVNSSREAKRILESIKSEAATFEDAARAQSQDSFLADRGGDMGIRYAYDLQREITNPDDLEKIFNLRRGELSDVVQLDDSKWAFFRIEDEAKPANFDDYAVMDQVQTYMRNYQRGRMEDWAISQARDFMDAVNADGFVNVTRWRNMEVHRFDPVSINYGNLELFPSLAPVPSAFSNSSDFEGLAVNANFWRTIFSTKMETPSEPVVQGRNVLVFYPTQPAESDYSKVEEVTMMYGYWHQYMSSNDAWTVPYFMSSKKLNDRFKIVFDSTFFPPER
jgi:hypothetical protein